MPKRSKQQIKNIKKEWSANNISKDDKISDPETEFILISETEEISKKYKRRKNYSDFKEDLGQIRRKITILIIFSGVCLLGFISTILFLDISIYVKTLSLIAGVPTIILFSWTLLNKYSGYIVQMGEEKILRRSTIARMFLKKKIINLVTFFKWSVLCCLILGASCILMDIPEHVTVILNVYLCVMVIWGLNLLILFLRTHKGYWGNNEYEARQAITFILEKIKKDKDDFIDSDGKRKKVVDLDMLQEEIRTEWTQNEEGALS